MDGANNVYIGRWDHGPLQCSRSKSSMPFKHDLPLQNIPLPKQPIKMQPQIEKRRRRHLKSSIQTTQHKNQQV